MKFGAIGIVVADMDASLRFYQRLGLEVTLPPDEYGGEHAELRLPGEVRLMLDTAESIAGFLPGYEQPPPGPRTVALAFECPSPADVDAAYADLTGAGYEGEQEPWDAYWGQRYAAVRDPDGTVVDLYASLPG